jgi:hypothetical protein
MPLDILNVTPEQSEVVEASTDVGAPVKSGAPTKGGISPVGTTLLNPKQTAELLANMERMIAAKTGPYATLMGGVQDALAYATPQAGGQQALALQYRNQQKRQEMEDIFGMRQQMAALNASSQQAQAQRDAMGQILGGGAGAGAGGQGMQADVFGGTEIPPEVRQSIAMDPVNGPAILQQYLKTSATERTKARLNPAWYEPTEVVGVDGQIVSIPRLQAVELAMQNPNNPKNRAVIKASSDIPTTPAPAPTGSGVNQFNVGNVRPVGQSTGFQQPKSYDEGMQIMDKNLQAYGQKGINTLRGVISRWAPPNENDTEALIKNASQRLGLRPDQPIDLSNPVQRQAIGTAIMLQEKGPKGIFTAPTQAEGPPRARPGESASSLKLRQEQWKEDQASERKVKEAGESAYSGNVGKAQAMAAEGVDEAYSTSGDRLNRSRHSLSLVDDPGVAKMVGYLEKSGASAAILRQIRDGITMGRLGDINLKDFDATLAKTGATQQEIDKFNQLVNNLKTDELTEARSLLKGQGQVSDSERKLVSSMIGSISNTADALKTAIRWRESRAKLDNEMGAAFSKYRESKGEYASFGSFMRTDGRRIIEAHNARLADLLGVSPDKLAGNNAYDPVTPGSQSGAPKVENVQSLVDRYKSKK